MTADLRKASLEFGRQALHAIGLGLIHPFTNEPMRWVTDLPEDMKTLLDIIRNEVIPVKESFKFDNMYVGDPLVEGAEEIDFDFEDDE